MNPAELARAAPDELSQRLNRRGIPTLAQQARSGVPMPSIRVLQDLHQFSR
jgi:hypothetical protein